MSACMAVELYLFASANAVKQAKAAPMLIDEGGSKIKLVKYQS